MNEQLKLTRVEVCLLEYSLKAIEVRAGLSSLRFIMSSHFDEKSGLVRCITAWGWWSQTIEEVIIEVNVLEGTVSNDITCSIEPHSMVLRVHENEIIKVPKF